MADPPSRAPSPVAVALIGVVRAYQLVLSPWLPVSCRFVPSCSAYAIDALRAAPVPQALWAIARRLLRCGPWNKGGADPIQRAFVPGNRAPSLLAGPCGGQSRCPIR